MRKMCMILVVVMIVLLAGCQEAQKQESQQPAVWGQGELPGDWQGFFGNGNNARLNFVQSQVINNNMKAITEMNGRIAKLEETTTRIYDPNE